MIATFTSSVLLKEIESLHNLEKFLLAEKIPNPEGNLQVHSRWTGRT